MSDEPTFRVKNVRLHPITISREITLAPGEVRDIPADVYRQMRRSAAYKVGHIGDGDLTRAEAIEVQTVSLNDLTGVDADQSIKLIGACQNADVLRRWAAAEPRDVARQTVLAAIGARLSAINADASLTALGGSKP